MLFLARRRILSVCAIAVAALAVAGCGPDNAGGLVASAPRSVVAPAAPASVPVAVAALDPKFAALYQPMPSDKFPVPGVTPAIVRKGFERKEVAYHSTQPPGTIVVDPKAHYLY
jgi:lipoprotein-anchoring transpeptidase ErfK/SrfK